MTKKAMAMVNQPQQLFDTQTQQFVNTQINNQPVKSKSRTGSGGYKFKGGSE
jgi:hypothetical protein